MQGFAHNTARTGFLEGEMALPRHDAYTIEFTITKRNPMADDLGDPTDRCTVKLGPNLRNLQEVAVAKNIVDEYAGCARYEFTHGMRTDTLAWRFEFMSSTEAVESHFVVEQGAYAPRDIPDLEVTDGAISASRRVEAPSRHRRDSFPSDEAVAGLFFEFEPIRTASSDRDAPRRSTRAGSSSSCATSALRGRISRELPI